MKYLVVETHVGEKKFTHFIELRKDVVFDEVKSFVNHLEYFKGQVVDKVYFSTTSLSNW